MPTSSKTALSQSWKNEEKAREHFNIDFRVVIRNGSGLRLYPSKISLVHCLAFAFLRGVLTPGRDPSWCGYAAIAHGSQISLWEQGYVTPARQVSAVGCLGWKGCHTPAVLLPRRKGSKCKDTGRFWGRVMRSPSDKQLLNCNHLEASPPLSQEAVRSSRESWKILSRLCSSSSSSSSSTTIFNLSVLLRSLEEIQCWIHRGRADFTANEPRRYHLREAQFCVLVDISLISGLEKANSAENRAATSNHPYLHKTSSIPWRRNAFLH